jgi:hypothetical protein
MGKKLKVKEFLRVNLETLKGEELAAFMEKYEVPGGRHNRDDDARPRDARQVFGVQTRQTRHVFRHASKWSRILFLKA